MIKRRNWDEKTPYGRLKIEPRDIEILKTLLDYRFLTSSQIQRNFFSSKSFADRRLRKLYDHEILERIIRPVTQGKAELLYAIGPEGARQLSGHLGIPKDKLGWSQKGNGVKPEFIQHQLDLNSLRLAIEDVIEKSSGYTLLRWENNIKIKVKRGLNLIPDAYLSLATPRGNTFFFLELDRATETVTGKFRKKMESYQIIRERGEFKRQFGRENFRVLIVTTSEARLKSLLGVFNDMRLKILFWLTTFDLILSETILGNIWLRADKPGLSAVSLHEE
ncbi:MAG: replication-relaxation family protein [candidate division Zixibacteria bacterium]|nr:replication-relaxation family protein [candidate division Zixibacteria bacterium]